MVRSTIVPPLCGLAFIVAGPACGRSHSDDGTRQNAAGAELFASCDDDRDCLSGVCTFVLYASSELGVCTKRCHDDDACVADMGSDARCREVPTIPDLAASDADDNERAQVCLLPCTEADPGVYDCQDGERHFCGDDDAASCEVCGCDTDSFCDPESLRCRAYVHGGGECSADLECLSGHCEDDACTSGQGDPCETCDGTCGGPADALYCMPRCVEAKCPVDSRFWECLGDSESDGETYCSRVCNEDADCVGDGDVCELLPQLADGEDWPFYFSGFCHAP